MLNGRNQNKMWHVWFCGYDISTARKFIETEGRLWLWTLLERVRVFSWENILLWQLHDIAKVPKAIKLYTWLIKIRTSCYLYFIKIKTWWHHWETAIKKTTSVCRAGPLHGVGLPAAQPQGECLTNCDGQTERNWIQDTGLDATSKWTLSSKANC